MNNNLILLSGSSATGKSASLRALKDPTGVIYLNCESNKQLPFKSKFQEFTIVDPLQVYEAFEKAETLPDTHTIIIDSLTYLMDMYESRYVLTATNTMKAWGDFAQYFKNLMQVHVASSSKNVIMTAHTLAVLNEAEMMVETKVPVKGSLKNNGLESYFSVVISSKKKTLVDIGAYKSKLLNITDEEDMLGFKYLFQTMLTKDSVTERIRSPMGMWDSSESFIDNNLQLVIDRLHDYYN